MKVFEIDAVIEYRVTVEVEGEDKAHAMANFDAGKFNEIYMSGAEMINWDHRGDLKEIPQ